MSRGQPPGADAAAARVAGPVASGLPADGEADLERRFGALRRLYGEAGYARVRAGRVAIVGLGGVGSWAAEALARSGIARLVLIDLDHVAESNINRQVQALSSTLGQAKAEALLARIAQIHPSCEVIAVEDFVTEANWPSLLPAPVDVLIDACDQVRAKAALAAWALETGTPLIPVGAAGGRARPEQVEVADLGEVTHDPLLAALRQRLRQSLRRAQRAVPASRWGLRCVFSRETVVRPDASVCMREVEAPGEDTRRHVEGDERVFRGDGSGHDRAEPGPLGVVASTDGSDDSDGTGGSDGSDGSKATEAQALQTTAFAPGLNCAGYGSSVMVTACFGLVAAAEAVSVLRRMPTPTPRATDDSRMAATG